MTKTSASHLSPVVNAIATFLPGWTVQEKEESVGLYLVNADGASLFIRHDWKRKERLDISGNAPLDKNNQFPYGWNHDAHRISVIETKTPAQIAKEITRRLLPDYLPAYAAAVAKNADHEQFACSCRGLVRAIAADLGHGAHTRHDSAEGKAGFMAVYGNSQYPKHIYVNFEAGSPDSGHLKISADGELLRKIAQLVNAELTARKA